jgi:hypothetical protein
MVSRLVCLGVRQPSGTRKQFFFFFKIFVRQLWACWCGEPYLSRGRVCSLQLLLGLASAVFLGSECRGANGHILLFKFENAQPQEPGYCIHIPEEYGGPIVSPGTRLPFCRLLWLAGLPWKYSNPPAHGEVFTSHWASEKFPFITSRHGSHRKLRSLSLLPYCCNYDCCSDCLATAVASYRGIM